jgi:hypothetical protein
MTEGGTPACAGEPQLRGFRDKAAMRRQETVNGEGWCGDKFPSQCGASAVIGRGQFLLLLLACYKAWVSYLTMVLGVNGNNTVLMNCVVWWF